MQQLLNPFAQKYPDSTETSFDANASVIRFNRTGPFAGHYIAVGGLDGPVTIIDAETKGLVRILIGHVRPITSVCWSRNNRYLLTASLDSTAIIWDLSVLSSPSLRRRNSGDGLSARLKTLRFDAPVSSAQFHPRNSRVILACLSVNEVIVVDLRGGEQRVVADPGEDSSAKRLSCATWSPCGSRIHVGTTQGILLQVDPLTLQVLARVKIATSAVRALHFDTTGRCLIVSCADRALRLLICDLASGSLIPTHRFQDAINRTPWHSAGFSGDTEYVMGGAGHKAAHNVYIWDRESGTLVKVLEGPNEPLADCDWHPTRPIIASVGTSGRIYIWQTNSPDHWAAFAPGFEELEENVEYDEREDEFDIEDEKDALRRQEAEEDLTLDVLTADDSYPRLPEPSPLVDGSEFAKMARDSVAWADNNPDDDRWTGFFTSLDLLSPEATLPE